MRDQAPEQADGTISLAEYGVNNDRISLENRLAAAFGEYFGVVLANDSLTKEEQADRDLLLLSRYGTDLWNLEGEVE